MARKPLDTHSSQLRVTRTRNPTDQWILSASPGEADKDRTTIELNEKDAVSFLHLHLAAFSTPATYDSGVAEDALASSRGTRLDIAAASGLSMESVAGFSGRSLVTRCAAETRSLSIRRGVCHLRNGSAGRGFQFVNHKTASRPVQELRSERTKSVKVLALQTADAKAEPIAELKAGQVQEFHSLPSGLKLEVIVQNARKDSVRKQTPLVFIHGSMHAAWCWALHWMPFFSARGYDCYAISFLGQGASDVPQAAVGGTLDSHSRDIGHFIRSRITTPPVLVAHSFGGLVAQCYLSSIASAAIPSSEEAEKQRPRPAGVVFACSSPPTGNGPMVMRFLRKDLGASIKITLGFAAKMIGTSLSMCRDCLFSQDVPESKLKEYIVLMKRSSIIPILDLRTVSQFLPFPRPPQDAPPVLVLHAENDYIVDAEGSQEMAQWCRTKPVVVPKSAHDLMLDTRWEQAAQIVNLWLEENSL